MIFDLLIMISSIFFFWFQANYLQSAQILIQIIYITSSIIHLDHH